ncbi:unnamed protein product [Heligmosomoides polygyrus]|uniref:DUF5641 domain-containing protein n=1 Tax=Heligmosomoides polygyrus TaxID=6339 RepID=A0A183GUG8_HELPZ|nr:unnamed protein product [Heligmosomoides polygyrus]
MHAADEFNNDETIQRLWSLYALGIVDDHDPSMDSKLEKPGYVEDVHEFSFDDSRVYYIPHQAVFKESSSTTKLRVVFDASSKMKNAIPPSPQQSEEFLTASHNLAMWYKETLAVLDQFWEVWYNDYLAALRERHQTRSKNARSSPTTPHVGDVVLVADDNISRGQWNYGLIEKGKAFETDHLSHNAFFIVTFNVV